MHFTASPGSGHPIDSDDRASNQGGSPVETVVSALAACSAMDVISIAVKKRQRIARDEVHATASQRDEYPQVFTEITLVHEVWGGQPQRGRDPARDRAVRDEVLSSQRDALGRGDGRASPISRALPW